jgi:COX assembly protein 2
MHPPLDRPHPDCQEEVLGLKHCHSTNSKLKFWACNEFKFKLDKCFKEEKDAMLLRMNKGFETGRLEEDEQSAQSTGKNMSFQEFLATDKTFKKELNEVKEGKSTSWF